jgi:hypothetical protein
MWCPVQVESVGKIKILKKWTESIHFGNLDVYRHNSVRRAKEIWLSDTAKGWILRMG